MSASVRRKKSGARVAACLSPAEIAQSFPDQPAGSGPAGITSAPACAATVAVLSELWSSTTMTCQRWSDLTASPTKDSSFRAGMITQTDFASGDGAGLAGALIRQKPPRAAKRYTQAPKDASATISSVNS